MMHILFWVCFWTVFTRWGTPNGGLATFKADLELLASVACCACIYAGAGLLRLATAVGLIGWTVCRSALRYTAEASWALLMLQTHIARRYGTRLFTTMGIIGQAEGMDAKLASTIIALPVLTILSCFYILEAIAAVLLSAIAPFLASHSTSLLGACSLLCSAAYTAIMRPIDTLRSITLPIIQKASLYAWWPYKPSPTPSPQAPLTPLWRLAADVTCLCMATSLQVTLFALLFICICEVQLPSNTAQADAPATSQPVASSCPAPTTSCAHIAPSEPAIPPFPEDTWFDNDSSDDDDEYDVIVEVLPRQLWLDIQARAAKTQLPTPPRPIATSQAAAKPTSPLAPAAVADATSDATPNIDSTLAATVGGILFSDWDSSSPAPQPSNEAAADAVVTVTVVASKKSAINFYSSSRACSGELSSCPSAALLLAESSAASSVCSSSHSARSSSSSDSSAESSPRASSSGDSSSGAAIPAPALVPAPALPPVAAPIPAPTTVSAATPSNIPASRQFHLDVGSGRSYLCGCQQLQDSGVLRFFAPLMPAAPAGAGWGDSVRCGVTFSKGPQQQLQWQVQMLEHIAAAADPEDDIVATRPLGVLAAFLGAREAAEGSSEGVQRVDLTDARFFCSTIEAALLG